MKSYLTMWMVRCNNGAMQQWCDATMVRCNNGAMHKDHNGSRVIVRCNITTMPTWLYGAVQHGLNRVRIPMMATWLYGAMQHSYAGARAEGDGVSNIAPQQYVPNPNHSTL
jgi:hypothetical protein